MKPAEISRFFGRMFPDLAPSSHSEKDLIELAGFMVDDGRTIATPHTELSGYLYWGQFLDHDLILDLTPLAKSGRMAPEARINHRSPLFDLDSLYGDGPLNTPFLYELPADPAHRDRNLPPGNERFLLGATTPSEKLLDLPRSSIGRPLLGDTRNEENLILAQFHVMMLRFHNKVMDALDAGPGSDVGLWHASKFEQARRLVTWHYQYLVLKELLGKFVQRDILAEAVHTLRRSAPGDRSFFIPIEFSLAAYRFGHAMIRVTYNIKRDQNAVPLRTLLLKNSMGDPTWRALPDEWVIDWSLFFPALLSGDTAFGNVAHAIDILVARDLHKLPGPVPIDEPGPHARGPIYSLPAMTLLRGQRSGLPSGQRVAEALGEPVLTKEELVAGHSAELKDFFTNRGFLNDTPLWFYILQEASVAKIGAKLRLGRVGSRIVAETLVGSLLADPNSILNAGSGWTPPTWPALFSGPIDRISKLVLALR